MNKNSNHHRGAIGLEASVVLIAIVIVGAALSFVVINLGSESTQTVKTSITSALGNTESSLSISGKIIGHSRSGGSPLTALMVPLKIAQSGTALDLNTTLASISYLSNNIQFDDIYRPGCTIAAGGPFASPDDAWNAAEATPCIGAGENPISGGGPSVTTAIVYWSVGNTNTKLESGEHAILSIAWAAGDEPQSLDKFKIELKSSKGSILTIERNLPFLGNTITDLN